MVLAHFRKKFTNLKYLTLQIQWSPNGLTHAPVLRVAFWHILTVHGDWFFTTASQFIPHSNFHGLYLSSTLIVAHIFPQSSKHITFSSLFLSLTFPFTLGFGLFLVPISISLVSFSTKHYLISSWLLFSLSTPHFSYQSLVSLFILSIKKSSTFPFSQLIVSDLHLIHPKACNNSNEGKIPALQFDSFLY